MFGLDSSKTYFVFFVRINAERLIVFQQLNSKFPSIKFTHKDDVLDIRNKNELEIDVYIKPTNNNKFVSERSNNSWKYKIIAINFLVHCLLNFQVRMRIRNLLNFILVTPKNFKKYSLNSVSNNNFQNILGNPKGQVDILEKLGAYKVLCNDCDQVNIGKTKKAIKTRYKEHFAHFKFKKIDKSGVTPHVCLKRK